MWRAPRIQHLALGVLLGLDGTQGYFIGAPAKASSAFAALKSDGSVVAWGDAGYGGSVATLSPAGSNLTSGVVSTYSTDKAFAALKSDGSVVAWGDAGSGGSMATLSPVGSNVTSGVR